MNKRKRKKCGPKEDLTGKKFGKLTVIGFAGEKSYPSGSSKYLWRCECECGNISEPTGNALKTGNTTSCRKCIFNDLTGQVFGKLTVFHRIEELDSKGKLTPKWTCICSCGNTHDVSAGNLVSNNVKSCGCLFDDVQAADLVKRKADFLEKANSIHSGKYCYNLDDFENTNSSIEITCEFHGKFIQKVRDHIVGSGCTECSIEGRRLGKDEFIRRSIEKHGNKYDYTHVDYRTNADRVLILCPEHGPFEQIAASHMNGNVCFDCGTEKRHWNYKSFCLANPEFAEADGNLYLLKLTNSEESFLKIGVSRYFRNRLANYRKDGFDVEVLYIIPSTTLASADNEYLMLKLIKDNNFKYTPITRFAGWTECASSEFEEDILEHFRRLDAQRC